VTLYPFQQEGVMHLLNFDNEPLRVRASYLADRMGLGKTVQAAKAAAFVIGPGMGRVRNALVVAPASALENWRREWQKWGPQEDHTVGFISWAQVHKITPGDWQLVILDEAHYAKNRKARRTRHGLAVAKLAERAWLLSGTPMPNHPGELFAPIATLWPEILRELGIRTEWQWIDRFCRYTNTQYGLKVYGAKNTEQLLPYLRRIMLRRTVNDVGFQLPPIRVDVSWLPKDDRLDDAVRELGLDPAGLQARIRAEAANPDGSLSRLRRLLGELKAPAIASQLAQELEDREYQKIVVLAYHRSVLDLLRKRLAKYGVVGFDGGTRVDLRQQAIDDFRHDPSARVFIGQQQAAGVAINLQAASEIVLVEPAWSPDDNAQAIKRIHRIGSEAPCRARIFAVSDTADGGVIEAITRKTRMQLEVGL